MLVFFIINIRCFLHDFSCLFNQYTLLRDFMDVNHLSKCRETLKRVKSYQLTSYPILEVKCYTYSFFKAIFYLAFFLRLSICCFFTLVTFQLKVIIFRRAVSKVYHFKIRLNFSIVPFMNFVLRDISINSSECLF